MTIRQTMRIYNSKPLWKMDKETIELLHTEMCNWLWFDEYKRDRDKKRELESVISLLYFLKDADDFERDVIGYLF